MNNIQHIHEVLFLFQEYQGFDSEEAMVKIIKERLGDDVHFVSCSNEPFPITEVVEFLVGRNKIVQTPEGRLILHPQMKMCNGHEKYQH